MMSQNIDYYLNLSRYNKTIDKAISMCFILSNFKYYTNLLIFITEIVAVVPKPFKINRMNLCLHKNWRQLDVKVYVWWD